MYRFTHNHATKFAPTATTPYTGSIHLLDNPYGRLGPQGVPKFATIIPPLGGSNGSQGMAHNELANLIGTITDNKGQQADEHLCCLQSEHGLFSNCNGQSSATDSFFGDDDDNTSVSDLGLGMGMVSKFLLCCCFSSHSVHPILCRF
jgi:hypothetical protein